MVRATGSLSYSFRYGGREKSSASPSGSTQWIDRDITGLHGLHRVARFPWQPERI
jgi:hypothetical protein